MQEVYFKISIKSFEQSALQPAKRKIEELSRLVGSKETSSLVFCAGAAGAAGAADAADYWHHTMMRSVQSPRSVPDLPLQRKEQFSISLPSSKKRFTLLKSPHIDKKSREQFQLQTHKAQIETACYSREGACLLLLLLKSSELLGVEVKLAISYSTPFCR